MNKKVFAQHLVLFRRPLVRKKSACEVLILLKEDIYLL